MKEKKLPLRRRHARRVRRGRAPRDRAALAHRRSGADDGEPVQAHRAGKPHSAQHERAGARAASPRCSASPKRCANGSTTAATCCCAARSHRLQQIEHRLEVLGGYLIAYLNLDKVIKIIRNEDEPKPVLIKTFKLTDVQADAILNMRLRNLRQLEEMEIRTRGQGAARRTKRDRGTAALREAAMEDDRAARSARCARRSARRRRSASAAPSFAEAPAHDRGGDRGGAGRARADHRRGVREGLDPRAAAARSPICRALRSRPTTVSSSRSSPRPLEAAAVRHQRPLLHPRGGEAARRPRPRRAGPPVHRSRAGSRADRRCSVIKAAASFWWRADEGRGFIVAEDDASANTRKGKQMLNVTPPDAGVRDRAGRGRARRRRSAITARCWCSRSTRCRKWRAAAACGCSATRTAVFPISDLRGRGGPDLDRQRRPRVHADAEGAGGLAR